MLLNFGYTIIKAKISVKICSIRLTIDEINQLNPQTIKYCKKDFTENIHIYSFIYAFVECVLSNFTWTCWTLIIRFQHIHETFESIVVFMVGINYIIFSMPFVYQASIFLNPPGTLILEEVCKSSQSFFQLTLGRGLPDMTQVCRKLRPTIAVMADTWRLMDAGAEDIRRKLLLDLWTK